jgi:hypothetical protein
VIAREVLAGVARRIPSTDQHDYPPKTEHTHLTWMIGQLLSGAVTGDKAHRWLGFIQGVLAARGFLNVDDERNRTRPYLSADAGAEQGLR